MRRGHGILHMLFAHRLKNGGYTTAPFVMTRRNGPMGRAIPC